MGFNVESLDIGEGDVKLCRRQGQDCSLSCCVTGEQTKALVKQLTLFNQLLMELQEDMRDQVSPDENPGEDFGALGCIQNSLWAIYVDSSCYPAIIQFSFNHRSAIPKMHHNCPFLFVCDGPDPTAEKSDFNGGG